VVTQVDDKFPRGMSIMPASSSGTNGNTLLVAGQSGSMLTTYTIGSDGSLSPTGNSVTGPPNPTTVSFAEI
jgi:hypothetical protein